MLNVTTSSQFPLFPNMRKHTDEPSIIALLNDENDVVHSQFQFVFVHRRVRIESTESAEDYFWPRWVQSEWLSRRWGHSIGELAVDGRTYWISTNASEVKSFGMNDNLWNTIGGCYSLVNLRDARWEILPEMGSFLAVSCHYSRSRSLGNYTGRSSVATRGVLLLPSCHLK